MVNGSSVSALLIYGLIDYFIRMETMLSSDLIGIYARGGVGAADNRLRADGDGSDDRRHIIQVKRFHFVVGRMIKFFVVHFGCGDRMRGNAKPGQRCVV